MSTTSARTYPEGVTCWVDAEYPSHQLDEALVFYGGLFGWDLTTATPPGAPARYVIATLDGQDVAGFGESGGGAAVPAWNTYVAVDDVDEAAARIEAAGGIVVSPPADAGPGGRNAVCADPAGAQFRLWQARARLGAQVTNVPGAWTFSDLHEDQPALAFYRAVFPWQLSELGSQTMIQVPGYGDHLASTVDPGIYERQAAAGAPAGFADAIAAIAPADPGAPPHWHVTFSVADRDEAATHAGELGATVISTDETRWARTALIRDPAGAIFSVSAFTPPG